MEAEKKLLEEVDVVMDDAKYVLNNNKFKLTGIAPPDNDNEDNEDIKEIKNEKKVANCSFGVVIYMTKSKYKDNKEENYNIHFPYNNEIFGLMILQWFCLLIPDKVPVELVINHEHGTKNGKCHKQAFIKFKSRVQCKLSPAEFDIGSDNFICMAQTAKSENKLRNYCKKNDLYSTEPYYIFDFKEGLTVKKYLDNIKKNGCNAIKRIKEEDESKSIYDRVKLEPVWSEEVFYRIYDETSNKKEREFMIRNKKQIFEFRAGIDRMNNKLEHHWHFPEHAIKYYQEHPEDYNKLARAFERIHEWFKKYCISNDPENYNDNSRKKALLIYGPRGIGKTLFCRDLIEDPNCAVESSPFIVYCRQNIAGKFFRDKERDAQLLLLDDVSFVDKHKEMLKALIVGNSCAIESKFEDNYFWKKSLPCIILTNEARVWKHLTTQDIYKNEIYPIAISEYMGPPGTKREEEPIEPIIDDIMFEEIAKYEEKVEEWKQKQNAFNLLGKKHK